MASAVTTERIYSRQNSQMFYIKPTSTSPYAVATSAVLDMRDFKACGIQVLQNATVTQNYSYGIGACTAATDTTYTVVRSAAGGSAVGIYNDGLEIDVDELAALGSGFRYVTPYVQQTATNAAYLLGCHVQRAYPKRSYTGLTAASTVLTAMVVASTA